MKKEEKKYNQFWDKVQIQLDKRNLSLSSLADKTAISQSTLENYKYQDREPSFKNVCKIADALDISLDKLRI